MDNLFELPSKLVAKRILKEYKESDHPRDAKGRWTAGGVARGALAGGAALAGAAALGFPGARAILPGIRQAALRAKYRAARSATTSGAVLGRANRMPAGQTATAAMGGMMGTGGRSKPNVDITRYQLGRMSAATRRRMARGPGGTFRPTGAR